MSIRRVSLFVLAFSVFGGACKEEEDPCSQPDASGDPTTCVPGAHLQVVANVEPAGGRTALELESYPVRPFGDSVFFSDPWGRVWQVAITGGEPSSIFDREGCAAVDLAVTDDAVFAGLDCTPSDGVSRLVRIDRGGAEPLILQETEGVWFSRVHVAAGQVFFLSAEHPELGVGALSATTPSGAAPDIPPEDGVPVDAAIGAVAFDGTTAFWGNAEAIGRTEVTSGTSVALLGLGAEEVEVSRVDLTTEYVYWQECPADGCGDDSRQIRRITQTPPTRPELVLSAGFSASALVHDDVVYDVGPTIRRWKRPDYEPVVVAVNVDFGAGLAASDGYLFVLGGYEGGGEGRLTALELPP